MPDSTIEVLRQAIRVKSNVSATYLEHVRLLSPHALGYKRGVVHLLSIQVGGESSSGLKADPGQNWRCMAVETLTGVALVDGEWQTAPNHTQQNTCIDDYLEEVSY